MDNVAYVCKYTPLELLTAFGIDSRLVDGEQADFALAEARLHANLCCHAKATFQLLQGEQSVLLTDCCDSMRRVCDALQAHEVGSIATESNSTSEEGADFFYCMELPHDESVCARKRLASQLVKLVHVLEERTGVVFSPERFIQAFADESAAALPKGAFIAVLGARATPSLKSALEECFTMPVVDLTCSSYRDIAEPPAQLANASLEEAMEWYAGALLGMTPCMRMGDVSSRRALADMPGLAGIVYNTVKFCDYYAFDYMDIQSVAAVPVLKVESDYQPPAAGQLSTRLQAFRELIEPNAKAKQAVKRPSNTSKEPTSMGEAKWYAGIDSGSTSTNMVVLDADGNVRAKSIVRTGAKAQNGALAAWQEVREQLGAAQDEFAAIVATGYGRANIPFATSTVTEITCHARGVAHLHGDARCIIDIGGQDSKVICLDGQGNVENFVMNDKCAAGTGRFLEAMGRTLELSLDEMSAKGDRFDRDITISSMCTVFAESEVISLIADNNTDRDIIHGLNKSIASRTASMAKRAKGEAPFVMTGGVARNKGVVTELSKALGSPLIVPNDPDLCGALGAALFALEQNEVIN